MSANGLLNIAATGRAELAEPEKPESASPTEEPVVTDNNGECVCVGFFFVIISFNVRQTFFIIEHLPETIIPSSLLVLAK